MLTPFDSFSWIVVIQLVNTFTFHKLDQCLLLGNASVLHQKHWKLIRNPVSQSAVNKESINAAHYHQIVLRLLG